MLKEKRPRKAFALIAVIAGVALLALEVLRPSSSPMAERWFWIVVGILLVGLGVAGVMERADPDG